MNYRDYKKFFSGGCYHVFNRSVGQVPIFISVEDYRFFICCLRENLYPGQNLNLVKPRNGYKKRILPENSFSIVSYCLMPNHFHFLIKQNSEISISELITRICTSYSKYFNLKYDRIGGLFQGPFKSIAVSDDKYLIWLSAYIHLNPFTAGLVKKPSDWIWSSYLDYIGLRNGTICKNELILKNFANKEGYKNFVENNSDLILKRKEIEKYVLD